MGMRCLTSESGAVPVCRAALSPLGKARCPAQSSPKHALRISLVGSWAGRASSTYCSMQGIPRHALPVAAAEHQAHSSSLQSQSVLKAGLLAGAAPCGQRYSRGASAKGSNILPRGPRPSAAAATTAPASVTPLWADGQASVQPEAVVEYAKYAELSQLTYDVFTNKPSKTRLLAVPRPNEPGFTKEIKKASMDKLNDLLQPNSAARSYQIVDFLYANSGWRFDDNKKDADVTNGAIGILKGIVKEGLDKLESIIEQHNWIGFIAVGPPGSEGLHDVAVVFRGTQTSTEWASDVDVGLKPVIPWTEAMQGKEDTNSPKVADGFQEVYVRDEPKGHDPIGRSPQWQVHETLTALQKDPQNKIGSITFTGHSLGAAVAVLAAYDIAQDSCRGNAKVRAVTFAGPKVGDANFVTSFEKQELDLTRVVNINDIVPQVPGVTEALIEQIFHALPSGAVTSKPGDKDFKEKVIKAAAAKDAAKVVKNDVLSNLMAYLVTTELNSKTPLGQYKHIGPAVTLDSTKVSVMTQEADTGLLVAGGCWHNLEGYLYMLDPSRDPCLINKGCDCLKKNSVHGQTVKDSWWAHGPGTPVPPTCPIKH